MLNIYHYIAYFLKEEKIAKKLINRIEGKFSILEYMPKCYQRIEEWKDEYRKIIIQNFVVLYSIDDFNKKVYIIKIVYGGSNYLK